MPQPRRARLKSVAVRGRRPGSWPRQLAVAIALAVVGVGVYANSFQTPFVFDSLSLIRENRSVQQVWPWLHSFAGGLGKDGGNRPVGFLSFALDYACHGCDVWGYHVVNVAIHMATAWLLFDVVRRTL